MKNLKAWQLLLINLCIFIIGQLTACYLFWIGAGSITHGPSLQMMCVLSIFCSAGLNAFLWVLRVDV